MNSDFVKELIVRFVRCPHCRGEFNESEIYLKGLQDGCDSWYFRARCNNCTANFESEASDKLVHVLAFGILGDLTYEEWKWWDLDEVIDDSYLRELRQTTPLELTRELITRQVLTAYN